MARKLNPEEMAALNAYHKNGCGNMTRCKVNQPALSLHETDEHNLKMLDICRFYYALGHNFITEAVPNILPKRRVDIVILGIDGKFTKGGLWIEIELDKRRIKPDADITYLLNKDKTWIILE